MAPPDRRSALTNTGRRADPSGPLRREQNVHALPGSSPKSFGQNDPYLDYGRFLTPAGGVLIIYKDLDLRWRHTFWRLLAWSVATGYAAWHLSHNSPVQATWINVFCLVAIALLNWLIVARPVEVHRRIEVRPDCLILEGADIFWRERMEGGLPMLRSDEDGNQILFGVYGTASSSIGRCGGSMSWTGRQRRSRRTWQRQLSSSWSR